MKESEQLFSNAVGFVRRAFAELEEQSPYQAAALRRLIDSPEGALRVVVEVAGTPVVSCFAIVGEETHLIAAETLRVVPRVLN